jgi:hypothetical protein
VIEEKAMTTIYLLWYLHDNEFGHEDNKFIGAYSKRPKAEAAIEQLSDQPGFRNDPTQFSIYECTLDRTSWQEGFITVAEAMQPKD